jgi:hypothetical protein
MISLVPQVRAPVLGANLGEEIPDITALRSGTWGWALYAALSDIPSLRSEGNRSRRSRIGMNGQSRERKTWAAGREYFSTQVGVQKADAKLGHQANFPLPPGRANGAGVGREKGRQFSMSAIADYINCP